MVKLSENAEIIVVNTVPSSEHNEKVTFLQYMDGGNVPGERNSLIFKNFLEQKHNFDDKFAANNQLSDTRYNNKSTASRIIPELFTLINSQKTVQEKKKELQMVGFSGADLITLYEKDPTILRQYSFLLEWATEDFLSHLVNTNDPICQTEQFNGHLKQKLLEKWQHDEELYPFLDAIGEEKVKQILPLISLNEGGHPTSLFQQRPHLFDFLSAEIRVRDAVLRLGLKHLLYEEGIYIHYSALSRNRSYSLDSRQAPHELQAVMPNSRDLKTHIREHGDLLSFLGEWRVDSQEPHAFSFHCVQEKDKMHIVYVNRGLRASDSNAPAVSVYTVPLEPKSESQALIDRIVTVLKNQKRSEVVDLISDLEKYRNAEASTALSKSNQKIGNCSIANANMTWHLKLATELMKENPELNLTQAYSQRSKAYKDMRLKDRADALRTLVRLKDTFQEPNLGTNFIGLAIRKLINKDKTNPDRFALQFILRELAKNPEDLDAFIREFIAYRGMDIIEKSRIMTEMIPLLETDSAKKIGTDFLLDNKYDLEKQLFLTNMVQEKDPSRIADLIANADPKIISSIVTQEEMEFSTTRAYSRIVQNQPSLLENASFKKIYGLFDLPLDELDRKFIVEQLNRGSISQEHYKKIAAEWEEYQLSQVACFLKATPEILNFTQPDLTVAFFAQPHLADAEKKHCFDKLDDSTKQTVLNALAKDEEKNHKTLKLLKLPVGTEEHYKTTSHEFKQKLRELIPSEKEIASTPKLSN